MLLKTTNERCSKISAAFKAKNSFKRLGAIIYVGISKDISWGEIGCGAQGN